MVESTKELNKTSVHRASLPPPYIIYELVKTIFILAFNTKKVGSSIFHVC
jgi:hypothetical protein